MKNINRLLPILSTIVVALSVLLTGCQDVIELDLNSSNAQTVIKASLQEGEHLFVVDITQTTDYFNPGQPVPIDDAVVTLSENGGESTVVPFSENGQYATTFKAVAGKTYTLTVAAKGQTYLAVSYLQQAVELDTITAQKTEGFRPPGTDGDYIVYLNFMDPPATKNYYRVVVTKNGVLNTDAADLTILEDKSFDGKNANFPIQSDLYNEGDSLSVELRSIDEAAWNYYNTISSLVGAGMGGSSAAPANPVTNWSNNALGYFIAYSSSTIKGVIR
jgi:hypothetical protein